MDLFLITKSVLVVPRLANNLHYMSKFCQKVITLEKIYLPTKFLVNTTCSLNVISRTRKCERSDIRMCPNGPVLQFHAKTKHIYSYYFQFKVCNVFLFSFKSHRLQFKANIKLLPY